MPRALLVVVASLVLLHPFVSNAAPPTGEEAACHSDALACAHLALVSDAATLEASCRAGSSGACLASAYRSFRLQPTDGVIRKTAAIFDAACARGEPAGCSLRLAAGDLLPNGLGAPPREWFRGPSTGGFAGTGTLPKREVIEGACAKGDPASCLVLTRAKPDRSSGLLGGIHVWAFGVVPGSEGRVAYDASIATACAKGGAIACFRAGKSSPVEACRDGVVEACDAMFKPDAPVVSAADDVSIGAWLAGRCETGFFEACVQETRRRAFHASDDGRAPLQVVKPPVGRSYRESDLPPDPPHPMRAEVCEVRWQAGGLLRDETIDAFCRRDVDRRRTTTRWQREPFLTNLMHWERECLGRALNCDLAAKSHSEGTQGFIPIDTSEARRFARTGCDAEKLPSCRWLAIVDHDEASFARRVVKVGGDDLVESFAASPSMFQDIPGLRDALEAAASTLEGAGFEDVWKAFLEPFEGPADVGRAIRVATARLKRHADDEAVAFLDATSKDPVHGETAQRASCFSVGGPACVSLQGLLPHKPLPSYDAGQRRTWPPMAITAIDDRLVVLDNLTWRLFDLASGKLVGAPVPWVPEATMIRSGYVLGETYAVTQIQLGPSPEGPAGLAWVDRRPSAELLPGGQVPASRPLLALLMPGRPAVLVDRDDEALVVLDSRRLAYWKLSKDDSHAVEITRHSLLDGKPIGQLHRLERAGFFDAELVEGLLVVWDGDGHFQVLDVATGTIRRVKIESFESFQWIVLGPGAKVAAYFDGNTTRVVDLTGETARTLRTLDTPRPRSIDPTGTLLVDGWGVVFDLATGQPLSPPRYRTVPRGTKVQSTWSGSTLVYFGGESGVVGDLPKPAPPPRWSRTPLRLPELDPIDLPERKPPTDLRLTLLGSDGQPLPAGTRVTATPDQQYRGDDKRLRAVAKFVRPWKATVMDGGVVDVKRVGRGAYLLDATLNGRKLQGFVDAGVDERRPVTLRPR